MHHFNPQADSLDILEVKVGNTIKKEVSLYAFH